MYVGSGPARQIIRQHEFYVKESKKHKDKHQGPSDKHHQIKFDALLTSYETVLADAGILKGIKWDSMVRSLPNNIFSCWHPLSNCPPWPYAYHPQSGCPPCLTPSILCVCLSRSSPQVIWSGGMRPSFFRITFPVRSPNSNTLCLGICRLWTHLSLIRAISQRAVNPGGS